MTPESQIKQFTVPEFAERIRKKFPAYKDLSDEDLTTRILDKHPEYKTHVAFETRPRNQAAAEAEAARASAQFGQARDAYMSATGQVLNPPVTERPDYFRPLTTTEKAAQKRGEPVIISSTQPQIAPVAPEMTTRPRKVTEPPVSLAPVVQGRLEAIQKQNRQKEIRQKVQQARQVRERAQGLVLPKGQRNQGAAYQPKFGLGQTYREVPKIDKSVPNVAEMLAGSVTEKPLTFEQDRAVRADTKREMERLKGRAGAASNFQGEEYQNFLRLNRTFDSPKMREDFLTLKARQRVAEHGSIAGAILAEDEETARRERVAQMGNLEYAAQLPKGPILGVASGAGTALKGLAVASRKIVDQITDTKGFDTRDAYVYQLGEAIEKNSRALLQSNPDLEKEFFVGKAPEALGQSALFLLGGWASKSPKLAISILGGTMTAGDAYEEVRALGGTDEEAVNAGLLAGAILGPTELIGTRGLVKALEGTVQASALKTALKQALATGSKEGIENAVQEVGQEAGQGLITGNPRSLAELAEAGALGGIAGLVGTGTTTLGAAGVDALRNRGQNIVSDYLAASPLSTAEERAATEKSSTTPIVETTGDKPFSRPLRGRVVESPAIQKNITETITTPEQASAPDQKPEARAEIPSISEPIVEKPQQIQLDQISEERTAKTENIIPETIRTVPTTKPTVETPAEVKTQPSATESRGVTKSDLDREIATFNTKGYGEWDMFTGRVPAKDNPSTLVLENAGITEGDKVKFFAERERSGTVQRDPSGELQVVDSKGARWGVQGILRESGGYIKPVPTVTPAPVPTKPAATESQLPQVKEAKDVTQESVTKPPDVGGKPVYPTVSDEQLAGELESVDFYRRQGYDDIAEETLDLLERKFGPHPAITARRKVGTESENTTSLSARVRDLSSQADAAYFETAKVREGEPEFEQAMSRHQAVLAALRTAKEALVAQWKAKGTIKGSDLIEAADDPLREDYRESGIKPDDRFELRDINVTDLKGYGRPITDAAKTRAAKKAAITPGPIVVTSDNEIVDGFNRAHEALQRGDKTIEAWVAKARLELEQKPTTAQTSEERTPIPPSKGVGAPSKGTDAAQRLQDWGSRLKTIAQSKDLNALQALSDEMAAHKDDPRVARLRTAIQDELARARQPEIPERAPERPAPQKLSKSQQKALAEAETPEGKTVRPAPTHRIGVPKPDASRNSLEQQVRAYGGVKDDASQAYKGELGWLKESATRGTVNQTGGISVEEMATKLAQDGYGKGVWWEGAPNNVDPQKFLQAVMDDTRGTKQYSTERDVIEDDPDVKAWDALVEGAGAELIERVSSGRATAADIVTLTREAQANGLSDQALDAFVGGLQDAVSEALPESTETGEGYSLSEDGTLLDPDGNPLFARQLPLTSDELIQEQARPKETDQRERLRREQAEREEAADPLRAAAVRTLAELKRRGFSIDEYARQGVLFGTPPSEEEIALLKEVERGSRAPVADQPRMFARGLSAEQRIDAAIEEFGLTNDPREAGFILADGRMLDFSGSRRGGPRGQRAIDHSELGVSREDMREFMRETGAVRFSLLRGGNVVVDMNSPLSEAQFRTITRTVEESIGIEVTRRNGESIFSRFLDSPDRVTLARVLREANKAAESVNFARGTNIPSSSFSVEGNRVSLNLQGAEILTELYEEASQAGQTKGRLRGTFERKGDALARNLDTLAARGREGAKELADAVRQAAKSGNGKVVLFYGESAKKHELFHEASDKANRLMSERHADLPGLINTDTFRTMSDRLIAMGYPGSNLPLLVEEAAAHIAEGRYDQLGITREQAVEWMFKWFQSFEQANPNVNPREFQEMSDEATKARDEVYRTESALREPLPNEALPSLQERREGGDRESIAAAREPAQREYPLADRDEWYSNADYKARGGRIVEMSPDEFLAQAKPLEVDEGSRDNIDDLKRHIQSGRTLDPAALYADGKTDGRHRAIASKELGIEAIPVIDFRKPADITQTEVFKRWFGDSKVVDEDGKPLVVYHGAGTLEELTQFEPPNDFREPGVWFSKSKRYAAGYGRKGFRGSESGVAVGKERRHVLPVYLSLQNPLDLRNKTERDRYIQKTKQMGHPGASTVAREMGFDGIIFDGGMEILVFEPSQIKSATGNRGTFDPNDPNILMARSGEEEDYQGEHAPADAEGGAPLHDLNANGIYPDDVYGFEGRRYYSTGYDALDAEAHSLVRSYRDHPGRVITIYRAVPRDAKGGINAGDWVTPIRGYAVEHGKDNLGGDYKIQKKTVFARDLYTDGNSWLEWGYDPQPFNAQAEKAARERRRQRARGEDPLFARSGDPWSNLTELSDEFGRLANEPELAPGEKPLSLPQTLEDAGLEAGPARGYLPESIQDDGLERAKQVISEKGIDGAIEFVKTGDGIEWASTGYEVSARLREEESKLRAEGKAEEADKTRDKRLTFLDDFASAAVERGRSIVGIKAISEFAPDRMAYALAKASRKKRKRGLTPEEESKITKLGEELGLLEERNKELEKRLAEATKRATARRQGKGQKSKKTDYQSKLEQQASTVLQTLKPKLGKLDLSGLTKESERGAVKVGIPALPGDAELIAQYAAAQLAKFNTVSELNAHLLSEFGQDIDQFLPKIRQRAYAIRQEARLAEIEASDTEPKRRKTILSEIQKEIAESLTAIREAQKAQDRALKAEKAAQAKSERTEARLEAKQARESEREARKQEIKDARTRLKQQRQEYKQASQAETKGYRETIKAQREAERKAELWDTPLRNAAAEARERLQNATDATDPQTAADLIAVAAEKFLPTEIGGNPRAAAVDPSRVYKDLKDEFPALVSKKNQGDLYKKGYQRIQDATAAAREAARLRSASAEAKRLWDELGIDVDAQAVLIQQAEVRRQTDELRRKAQAEFQRVSRTMIEKIWMEAQAIPRSLQSSIDAPIGRQGAYFLLTHPLETMKTAVPATLKGYGSIHVSDYIAREKELAQHPDYKLAVNSGLELSQTTGEGDPALVAEEQFQSSLASRFLPHVRLSEQAYVLGMNAQRLAMFSRLADTGRAEGYTPETNPEFFEAVARFVNDGTGRGNLPDAMKRASALLNFFFFSTRLNVSRLQLLNDLFNPIGYLPERANALRTVPGFASYDPVMRKVVAKELVRLGVSLGTVFLLASAMGIKIEYDLDDPDALLLRIRNTRYDVTGGEAGTIRFLYRFMRSIYRTAAEEDLQPFEQPLAIIGKFLRYKLAPLPSGTIDAITGKDAVGQPANLKKFESPRQVMQENVIIKRTLPILAGNVLDTVSEEGWIGVPMVLPALAGFGVSSYPDRGIRAIKNQAVVDLLESLKITSNSLLGQKTKDEALDKVIQSRIMEKVETLDIPQGATEVGKEKIVQERLAQIRNLARAEAAIAEPKLYADYLKSKEGSESVSVLTDEEKKTLTAQDLTNYRSRYAEAYVEMLQRASQAPNWSKLTADEKEKVLARIPRIAHNRAKIDLVKTKRKGTP